MSAKALHVAEASDEGIAPVWNREGEGLADFRFVEYGVMRAGCEILVLLAQDRAHLAAYRLGGRLRAMGKDGVINLMDGEGEVVP